VINAADAGSLPGNGSVSINGSSANCVGLQRLQDQRGLAASETPRRASAEGLESYTDTCNICLSGTCLCKKTISSLVL